MKKIILLLLLILIGYGSVEAQPPVRIQMIGNSRLADSALFLNLNKNLWMHLGFTTNSTSTMFGALVMSDAGILLSGTGGINVSGSGSYLLGGVNILSILHDSVSARLHRINTWDSLQTYLRGINVTGPSNHDTLTVTNKLTLHNTAVDLTGATFTGAPWSTSQLPDSVKFVGKGFSTTTKYFSSLQTAADNSGAGSLIIVYPGTYTENVRLKNANIYMYEGAVIQSSDWYAMVCDSVAACNIKIRGKGVFTGKGGVRMSNNNASSIIDVEAYAGYGWNNGTGFEGISFIQTAGANVQFDFHTASGGRTGLYVSGGSTYWGVDSVQSTVGYCASGSAATVLLSGGNMRIKRPLNVVSNCANGFWASSGASVYLNGLNVKNLNDTGHCIKNSGSLISGTIGRIDNHLVSLNAAVENFQGNYDITATDSITCISSCYNGDVLTIGNINGGKWISSGTWAMNNYGGGTIQNALLKSTEASDAQVVDVGNGTASTKSLTFLNCTIEGKSPYGVFWMGRNNSKLTMRNTTLYNANLSGYGLRNYSSPSKIDTILSYSTYTNVPNFFSDSSRYFFPVDSVRKNIISGAGGSGDVSKSDSTVVFATPTQLNNFARPYKVYSAWFSQLGSAAPTVKIMENTFGGSIVWSYESTGNYVGTLTGAFPADSNFCSINDKTQCFEQSIPIAYNLYVINIDANTMKIQTFIDDAPPVDGVLNFKFIEFRQYY